MSDIPVSALGIKVKELRESKRYTLGKLAKKSKVSLSYISELERGAKKSPSAEIIKSLAGALKVPDKVLMDTYYVKYCFSGINYYMIECNYALDILKKNCESGKVPDGLKNRLLQSHFSLANVKKFFTVNDLAAVKQIYLLHLSAGNSDAARFKREVQELTGKPVIIA